MQVNQAFAATLAGEELPEPELKIDDLQESFMTQLQEKWQILLIGSIIILVTYIYLQAMLLTTIANAVKHQDHKNLANKTFSRIWSYIAQSTIQGLLTIIPAIILGLLLLRLVIAHQISSLFWGFSLTDSGPLMLWLTVIAVPAIIIYLIWISIKLFFAKAIIFMDETGPIVALSKSYKITKNRKKEIVLLLLCIAGLGIISNQIANPFGSALFELFFSSGAAQITGLIVFTITGALLAATSAYTTLFLFCAYKQFEAKNAKA